jgi:hypothetical protein
VSFAGAWDSGEGSAGLCASVAVDQRTGSRMTRDHATLERVEPPRDPHAARSAASSSIVTMATGYLCTSTQSTATQALARVDRCVASGCSRPTWMVRHRSHDRPPPPSPRCPVFPGGVFGGQSPVRPLPQPVKRVHVCATPGCANYAPCPDHSRPANASWSKDRDHKAHSRLRRQVIQQRGPHCERCGWTTTPNGAGLEMHHVGPKDTPADVILVCGKQANGCHAALDTHAR